MPHSCNPHHNNRFRNRLSHRGPDATNADSRGVAAEASRIRTPAEQEFPSRIRTAGEEELHRLSPAIVRSYKATLPPPPPPDWDGYCRRDMGPDAVRYVYDKMAIDEEWSVWKERSFHWWGYRLRQTVRALAPVREGRFLLTRVVICTDFLRDVPDSPRTLELLSALNMSAVMHSWIWNRSRRKIQLLSVGVVNEETAHWMFHQLAGMAALQCHLAHELAEPWSSVFGARPDWSPHPVGGFRPQPDDMVRVIDGVFRPWGERPSLFAGEEFLQTVQALRSRQLLSEGCSEEMSAELPFFGGRSALQLLFEERVLGQPPEPLETALIQMSSRVAHPRLGNGLFALLRLPLGIGNDMAWGHRFAAHLNRRWRIRGLVHPRFGAWCVNAIQNEVAYVLFVPNFQRATGLVNWVAGHLAVMNHTARLELCRYLGSDTPAAGVIPGLPPPSGGDPG